MSQIDPKLELHHAWTSSASRRVRFTLEEKELPYDSILLDLFKFEQHSPEYLRLNPNGWVPTLIHNGRPIIESSIICEYLDEVFPDHSLRPDDPHALARMRVWSKWVDEVVIRAFQVASWNIFRGPTASRMSDEELAQVLQSIPVPDRREDWRRIAREPFSETDIEHALANIRCTLDRMESDLSSSPWLAGESFSLADIHLSPYIVRIDEHAERGILLAEYPHCEDWWNRLKSRPAITRAKIEPISFEPNVDLALI